jgi:drug/metabolite transporter (DMT)-like permease
VIEAARQEVQRLRELTTSGTGSRWLGIPVLLTGVAFSTWPDGWAEIWPAWLSATVLAFLVTCCVVAWVCWAIGARLRTDSASP